MDPFTQRRGSINPTTPLSLEATLDEENREVLARYKTEEPRSRTARGLTPPPPVRSMLNVGPTQHTRHGSFPSIDQQITSPRDKRKAAPRLDPSDPSTWTRPHRPSSPASPRVQPTGLPKVAIDEEPGFEKKYNFDMSSMPTASGAARGSPKQLGLYSAATLGPDSPGSHPRPITPTIDLSPPDAAPGKSKTLLSPDPIPLNLTPDVPHQKATLPVSLPEKQSRRLSDRSNKSSSFSDAEPTGRIERDADLEEDVLANSSDDDDIRDSSSEDEAPESTRGRTREKVSPVPKDEVEQKPDTDQDDDRLAPQSRVRSLLDPVTSPSRPHDRKEEVHPASSFGKSGPSVADFEEEDSDDMEADIQKAKTLGVHISPVDNSIPDRDVRMIIRGDWARLQDDTGDSNHTPKLYLACTDMSHESSYALEWTVGTMLRDGDTLLAIYAIEDENAPKESEGSAVIAAESAKAAQETSDTMTKLTRQTTDLSNRAPQLVNKFIPVTEALSSTGSVDARHTSKHEMERLRAMDEITNIFLKLVRKTPLQIRCMVEVIHCKSPKHLILNAIDTLEPTLCVVGTRGRNSLKGVLLGSFSNYLVTKSSVPVMVARKRLKKPRHAKVNSSSIRLANNLRQVALTKPRKGLKDARID